MFDLSGKELVHKNQQTTTLATPKPGPYLFPGPSDHFVPPKSVRSDGPRKPPQTSMTLMNQQMNYAGYADPLGNVNRLYWSVHL